MVFIFVVFFFIRCKQREVCWFYVVVVAFLVVDLQSIGKKNWRATRKCWSVHDTRLIVNKCSIIGTNSDIFFLSSIRSLWFLVWLFFFRSLTFLWVFKLFFCCRLFFLSFRLSYCATCVVFFCSCLYYILCMVSTKIVIRLLLLLFHGSFECFWKTKKKKNINKWIWRFF